MANNYLILCNKRKITQYIVFVKGFASKVLFALKVWGLPQKSERRAGSMCRGGGESVRGTKRDKNVAASSVSVCFF
jgi:hypothetical protein